MKKSLLAVFCVTLALPLSGAFAQGSNSSTATSSEAKSKELDGNYLLTLVERGKDQPAKEISVVVATPAFSVFSVDPNVNFSGTCNPQGDGTYLVTYGLGRSVNVPSGPNSFQTRNVSIQASVRLRLGETAQITKDGELTYTLKLDRYQPETK